MSMHHLLSKLEEERYSWIGEGIEEFRQGFLRLSPAQSSKKEVLIGVYGPTQVGKTTLILKILGIQEDKMKEISRALRGNRGLGNSATITATVYHRSIDDIFTIIYPNGEKKQFETIEMFRDGMGDVRSVIESDATYSTKPIHVYFANEYFNEEEIQHREKEIVILDLPGDDSREERELNHVDRCLEEYLPHCRLCLVMEIGSQMVGLTQITREHVQDWGSSPELFRIVLTRALTSSSVREKIKDNVIHSKQSLHQHFEYELKRLMKANQSLKYLYPLEFGDSLQDIKENDTEYYQKVSPWINEIYQQLIEDIDAVDSPEREILQVLNLEGLAQKRKEHEVLKLNKDKEVEELKLEELEISIRSYQKRIENIEEEIIHYEEFVHNKSRFQKISCPTIYKISSWDARTVGQRTVSSIHDDFEDSLEQLNKDYEKVTKQWNRLLKLELQSYSNIHFTPIVHTKIEVSFYIDRLFDQYFRKSTFKTDYTNLLHDLEEANEQSYKNLTSKYEKSIDLLVKQFKKQIYLRKSIREQYVEEMSKLEMKKTKVEIKISEIEHATVVANQEWDHDIERTNELYQYLKKAFLRKVSIFQEVLSSPRTDINKKWAYHQYWNIVTNDAERIILNGN